ncbi:putative exported protein [Gigaspora margarita]|uniref:Putative exported protein n=1 Tax=Gigaspora margarita TaxID=4874 RepID=A0A8H3WWK8_GIGMA|nr:putative exported protein [Gigaspora margarita]
MISTKVGNYEFPKGIEILQNITPPADQEFKFYLVYSRYSWHRCVNKTWIFEESRALFFNHEEDISCYPRSASAITVKNAAVPQGTVSLGVRSIIQDYDTSQLITTAIASIPKPDVNDIPLGLEKTSNNAGKGAFEDITYIVHPKTKGRNIPIIPCGNDQFPEGYIHSRPFILYNLFYHPKKSI